MSTPTTPQASTGASSTSAAVTAANALLATLGDAERATVGFAFDDAAQRVRWSNFASVGFRRAGLRLGDLAEAQRDAVLAVLAATLSAAGYRQVLAIMDGDELLRADNPIFGRDQYWFALLGTPSEREPWRWQFGGHHLGLNATFVGDDVTLAPSLTGAQPAEYTAQSERVRTFGPERDAAYALLDLLDQDQRRQAIIAPVHIDLVLGPGKDGENVPPAGLSAARMSAVQRCALLDLIAARIRLVGEAAAVRRLAAITADLDETWFAWAGPIGATGAAYWRILGPTVLIEYAPQWFRSGEPDPDHVHAIYRDPANDYGDGWLSGQDTWRPSSVKESRT